MPVWRQKYQPVGQGDFLMAPLHMILRGMCLPGFLGVGRWDAEQRLVAQEVPPATLRGRWQL
jgi:hypothetical protein